MASEFPISNLKDGLLPSLSWVTVDGTRWPVGSAYFSLRAVVVWC
jgi:hypothetical protein